MGYEYLIRFHHHPTGSPDRVLRQAPHFARFLPDHQLYEYRSAANAALDAMPDANAALRADGFYFCDNVGDPSVIQEVLTYLRAYCERHNQSFQLEELE